MIRFNNDYSRTCHPAILSALENTNTNSYGGYGLDELSSAAAVEIQKYIKAPSAAIHFVVGGTQANFIGLDSLLRPFESVICAETGHINVHETGALEHCGHKILALPAVNGKISASQIEEQTLLFENSPIQEHITAPKAVYISFPTEYGTIYSKKELEEISRVCHAHGLYLFIDGARLGYGLGAKECDIEISDLPKFADIFTIGGTKCGMMFGEAIVITEKSIQKNFRSYMKQNGAMLAKGWLLGIQFLTMFKDGLYFEATKNACTFAQKIKDAFKKKNILPYIESPTNQQFFVVTEEQKRALAQNFIFDEDVKTQDGFVIRFCTSWSTTEEEANALIDAIEKL